MIRITSLDEMNEFVSSNKLALIGFVDSSKEADRVIIRVLNYLEGRIGTHISFALCDVREAREVAKVLALTKTPYIKLYLNGRSIFEQEGSFNSFERDVYVLRISIKEVLRSKGIWLKF